MDRRLLLPAALPLALAACGGGGNGGSSNPPPPPPTCNTEGLETPRAFSNLMFTSPTAMMQAPSDGSRWFVLEQGGVVRTFPNDPDAASATDFLDISSKVLNDGEAGLLGMAFHPDFATNGLVYVNFT